MSTSQVTTINLHEQLKVIGKTFIGDYSKSSQYIMEIQKELSDAGIPFIQTKVMGVYYDNPNEKKAEELKSFQGVFVTDPNAKIPASLTQLSLKGNYLYVKATGEIMNAIYEGYGALFIYIAEKAITLKSPAGYQVSTFENDEMTTEIYMELN
ncbi:hypothetical protein BH11BAC1_BH11BAC1_09710 [soil metagenome]